MKSTSARRRRALLAPIAVAACLWVTANCTSLVGDGDYRVGASTGLMGCTLTPAMTVECPSGQTCVGELCETVCNAEADCPSNWHCITVTHSDAGSTMACLPHCNPLAPEQPDTSHIACGLGETCLVVLTPAVAFCPGGAPGTQGQDQACSDYRACLAGYACVAAPGSTTTTCHKYCAMGKSDCGGPGLTCRGVSPKFMDGQDELGYCAL